MVATLPLIGRAAVVTDWSSNPHQKKRGGNSFAAPVFVMEGRYSMPIAIL